MLQIETFPIDDVALVMAPASGTVAVVDASARTVLDGLQAGRDLAELAQARAIMSGMPASEALRQVRDLHDAWSALVRPRARPMRPSRRHVDPGPPALDAWCQVGPTPVRLRIWPPRLAGLVAAVTGPCRNAAHEGACSGGARLEVRRHGRRYRVDLDDERALTTDDLMIARSEILRRLILAGHPGRQWLAVLHAAGVVGPAGAALLCGFSGAGKSTLTGFLLAAGMALATDDYAPIEAGSGLLWPVPFGLSFKEGSWPLLAPHFPQLAQAPIVRSRLRRQRYVAPLQATREPQPVRCLVFPLYRPGTGVELTELRPGEALALCARSGGWYESSRERLAELVGWLKGKPAYALSYADTAQAVATVRRLLRG